MAAATDISDRLLTGLQSLIASLNLQATSNATTSIGAKVFAQLLPERLAIGNMPCVILTYMGETEEEPNDVENFEEQGVTYPVSVLIVDQMRTQYQLARPDYLNWRHAIKTVLRNRPRFNPQPHMLDNVPELANIRLRNKPVWVPKLADDQLMVSAFAALCDTNETRT